MYYYALSGYLIYKFWECSYIIKYAISTGNGIRYAYKWINSKKEDNNQYLDWVLVLEHENSPLKKKKLL